MNGEGNIYLKSIKSNCLPKHELLAAPPVWALSHEQLLGFDFPGTAEFLGVLREIQGALGLWNGSI